MNRIEEYRELNRELDIPVPEAEELFSRVKRKDRRRKWIQRPAACVAAVFACFVLLVNFWAPAAYACSRIPGLKELAEAVSFSRSLQDAVENEYVQPVDIRMSENGVELTVEHLIVDQKQVNVFFRLDSESTEYIGVNPEVLDADGNFLEGCAFGCNDFEVPNGEMQSLTIDFIDNDVPGQLRIRLEAEDLGGWQMEEIAAEGGDMLPGREKAPVAIFEFLLSFDPEFTAAGRRVELNREVELDGQRLCFTELEIYPTHIRINLRDDEENTAWLKRLDFYVETDWGMRFEPVQNGITATGSEDSPMMVSYRADSTYFYEAKHLKIVVTGAEWLDKDMERIYVDLERGEADRLPEGVNVQSVERAGNGWIITVKAQADEKGKTFQVFDSRYYDGEGTEYYRGYWQTRWEEDGFLETFPLEDYPYGEVWLAPRYSRRWKAEEKIEVVGW